MSTTTEHHQRSWLMKLLRSSPGPLLHLCLAGGALMVANRGAGEREQVLWDVGTSLLALGGIGFIALLWGGVYLLVVEASRGMPGLWVVDQPTMAPEPAAKYEELKRSLSGLVPARRLVLA